MKKTPLPKKLPFSRTPSIDGKRTKIDPLLVRVLVHFGGRRALAKLLGISDQALWTWRKVPPMRAAQVADLSRGAFTAQELAPELYGTKAEREKAKAQADRMARAGASAQARRAADLAAAQKAARKRRKAKPKGKAKPKATRRKPDHQPPAPPP